MDRFQKIGKIERELRLRRNRAYDAISWFLLPGRMTSPELITELSSLRRNKK